MAVGIAAAAARLEEYAISEPISDTVSFIQPGVKGNDVSDDLSDALNRLALSTESSSRAEDERTTVFNILNASHTKLDLSNHDAVRFIHGEAHDYIAKIDSWASHSETKIRAGESEIPTGYSQGDLYRTCQS